MTEQPHTEGWKVAQGVGLGLLLQVLQLAINYFIFIPVALLFIAATQLVYIVPTVIILRTRGHDAIAKGVIIAASLVALVNVTCWGVVLTGNLRIAH